MKKSDVFIALITGEVVALYFVNLFKNPIFWVLAAIFPLLSVFCLWVAYLLGKKFLFIYQFAKFILIGALATIFDLMTLSFFIKYSGADAGITYSVLKGISFIVATIAKYFADKFWAFEKKETTEAGKEFSKFFMVTIVGLFVNVATATIVVDIGPKFNLPADTWANIGGIVAVLPTFLWNFVGYKFIVFKK